MRRLAAASALAAVAGLAAFAGADDMASPAAKGGMPIGDGRGGFHLHKVASFKKPIFLEGPRGAGKVSYVVQREGRVKVLVGGRKRPGSFLDIHGQVSCCESERGMFSIAFQNYRRSPFVFVYYTDNQGDLRLDQFRRRHGSRFRVAPRSQRHLLDIRHRQAANHNGGQLQFGPDGYLYMATGDGGTGGDPAQRKKSLLGKLLRINPRGKGRYHVPRSNPYVGERGRDEIYARGLRNPWRFSFDRRHIAIGDVGQDRREELDYETVRGARGANFGWNIFEGTLRYSSGDIAHHDRPIFQYGHSGGRCAITGGYVSRNRRVRSLYRRYVYGDLCTGQLRSLIPRTRGAGGARDDKALGVADKPGLVSLGEDARHRLYVIQQSGAVYRIAPG